MCILQLLFISGNLTMSSVTYLHLELVADVAAIKLRADQFEFPVKQCLSVPVLVADEVQDLLVVGHGVDTWDTEGVTWKGEWNSIIRGVTCEQSRYQNPVPVMTRPRLEELISRPRCCRWVTSTSRPSCSPSSSSPTTVTSHVSRLCMISSDTTVSWTEGTIERRKTNMIIIVL